MSFKNAQEMAVLLMKKIPFTKKELNEMKKCVTRYNHRIIFSPDEGTGLPEFKELVRTSILDELREKLKNSYDNNFFDLIPPTDNQPFFFSMLKPFDFKKMEKKFPDWQENFARSRKYSSVNLIRKLVIVLFSMAFILILVPLFIRFDRRKKYLSGSPILIYFSFLGLGFMFIEVSTINRFSLLLGHPTYSLTIVLLSILVFAGLGSLAFSKLALKKPEFILYTISIMSFISWIVHSIIVKSFLYSSFNVRAVITILSIAPLCLPMGMALPLGVQLLSRKLEHLIHWAFALNGIFSVTGSALAMFLNLQGGYKLTFLLGVICYLSALIFLFIFKKMEKRILITV